MMIIRQAVFICAAAYAATGCAEIIGIEDLPELMDANSSAADITCMPEGVTYCYGPGYPEFEHEGRYPEDTPCSGAFMTNQRLFVTYQGQNIALSYSYHGDCGSFAKIENAPASCVAVLERSTDDGASWAWVGEIVEPGLNYAYTQMGNNLQGRESRAVLVCDGEVLERTGWF